MIEVDLKEVKEKAYNLALEVFEGERATDGGDAMTSLKELKASEKWIDDIQPRMRIWAGYEDKEDESYLQVQPIKVINVDKVDLSVDDDVETSYQVADEIFASFNEGALDKLLGDV